MADHELLLDEIADQSASNTVVLQPRGKLTGAAGTAFHQGLTAAIAAADAIVLDMLWVESLDQDTIDRLLSGLKQAHRLGKSIAFLSLDQQVRSQIETIWQQEHQTQILDQAEVFSPEFERFLEGFTASSPVSDHPRLERG
jgi:anti-anti-sigma regulatory factor